MIEKIKFTSAYKSLKLDEVKSHAYFFYSADKELNNVTALTFAKSLICSNSTGCSECENCKMFNSNSHPDVTILDKASIKVEDVNQLMPKLSTKPIISNKKVFVILNAESINETAQNKMLKSLEEPNQNNIFVMSATKTDKILPTVLSRLSKFYVPKLSKSDKTLIADELKQTGIYIEKYIESDFSLTDIINFETNEQYKETVKEITNLLLNLNNSADIPMVVSKLDKIDKTIFFSILQHIFITALKKNNTIYNSNLINKIETTYSQKAIIKCIELIEHAYTMQMSNVNFSYILDNLLFNILKEKFLCK